MRKKLPEIPDTLRRCLDDGVSSGSRMVDINSQIDGMDQSTDGKLAEPLHLEPRPEKGRWPGLQAVNENVNIVKNNVKHTSTSLAGLYHREKTA